MATIYVLFFIRLETRRIVLGGLTSTSDEGWVKQMARNVTGVTGELADARYLLHDRDAKYTASFDGVLESAGIQAEKLPAGSPHLHAFAERWVLSVKTECLDQLILFGERSLAHVLEKDIASHQQERNHQGLVIPFPDKRGFATDGMITKSERLGGMLNDYFREVA